MSVATAIDTGDIAEEMDQLGQRARAAVQDLAQATTDQKNAALLAAAVAFWRLAWIVAGSRLRGPMLRIEPFAFFLFCAHLILIWLGGPFLGHVFGRMGAPLYPVYLILQPAMVAAVVIPIGLLLRRYMPRAARILSGGRL